MQIKENDIIWSRIKKRRVKSIKKHPKIKLAPYFYEPFYGSILYATLR